MDLCDETYSTYSAPGIEDSHTQPQMESAATAMESDYTPDQQQYVARSDHQSNDPRSEFCREYCGYVLDTPRWGTPPCLPALSAHTAVSTHTITSTVF